MCDGNCTSFVGHSLPQGNLTNKRVLEVGSFNVNGSPREIVHAKNPRTYLGVDIQSGDGVDQVCDVLNLIDTFGKEEFDIVITCEMLEHVEDWRSAIHNLKGVLRKGGTLIITTRTIGFGYHDYPSDYWRYTTDDFALMFSDMIVCDVKTDNNWGIFLRAMKPLSDFNEVTPKMLEGLELYQVFPQEN